MGIFKPRCDKTEQSCNNLCFIDFIFHPFGKAQVCAEVDNQLFRNLCFSTGLVLRTEHCC